MPSDRSPLQSLANLPTRTVLAVRLWQANRAVRNALANPNIDQAELERRLARRVELQEQAAA
jgi:hypothetical protein